MSLICSSFFTHPNNVHISCFSCVLQCNIHHSIYYLKHSIPRFHDSWSPLQHTPFLRNNIARQNHCNSLVCYASNAAVATEWVFLVNSFWWGGHIFSSLYTYAIPRDYELDLQLAEHPPSTQLHFLRSSSWLHFQKHEEIQRAKRYKQRVESL